MNIEEDAYVGPVIVALVSTAYLLGAIGTCLAIAKVVAIETKFTSR